MIDLKDLGKFRKGRVWFSDIPNCKTNTNKIEVVVSSEKQPLDSTEKELAVELYYPRNMSNYGMLGLRYIPDETQNLEITVDFVSQKKFQFESSLVADYDKVYLGIPEEFSEVVLKTSQQVFTNSEECFSGKLEFRYGASAEVGSSPVVFAKLTEILIGILRNSLSSEEELKNFLSEKM